MFVSVAFCNLRTTDTRPTRKTDHVFFFQYILHMDLLQEDFMLVVEKTPVAISDQLPPALKQKKFGT